jgi:outer membrane protein OmpA-like peptidoglycan-associated protein
MHETFTHPPTWHRWLLVGASIAVILALVACAAKTDPRVTKRDKTVKGAAIGGAAGAVVGVVTGEREADEILARAGIGAAIGAGVGAYLDSQEERFGRIPGTHVERVADDMLLVHFDSDVLFAVDSAILGADAKGALDEAAAVLNDYPKTAVVIQGHTDSTGSEEYNQSLSDRRAGAVKNHLTLRGVDPSRMTTLGLGEGSPQESNDTEAGRRRNRRVDLLLKAKAT